ncbi:MAG: M13 family metallopeptidase [Candidatus Hodarchaeales archaeon]|jgi:putative endopeptidase
MNVNKFEVDKTIRPQDDFNLFTNKKWLDANPIPDDQSSWSPFHILQKENLKKIKDILEEDHSQKDFKNISGFFRTGMDSNRLEREDNEPLLPYLGEIDEIKSVSDIPKFLVNMKKIGLITMFSISSGPDAENTSEEIPYTFSGALGLPDRDYYLTDDKKEIKQKYGKYIKNILLLIDIEEDSASKFSEKILEMETTLAEVTYTNVEKRNPENYFNKITAEELTSKFSNFPWKDFYKSILNIDIPYLSMDNFKFYEKLISMFRNNEMLNAWKFFFKFKITSNSAPYLSDRFYNTYFDFYGKVLVGQQKPKPRYERVIRVMDDTVGELMGKAFVEKYFPSSSKQKMLQLVGNLNETLKERILNLDWMSQETKDKAMKKLNTFRAKIGYPDTWNDFSELDISENYSFLKNLLNSRVFKFKIDMKDLYKPSDPDRWEMSPHTINAYFHPLKNEIVFPAGILQYPFFDPKAHDAINYGGIGVVIGHELTHGYDDQGRKFDHKGELKNWWNDEDLAAFKKKSEYYVKEFNRFEIHGNKLNGELTLGENLADHGGIKISYYALQKHFEKEGQFKNNDDWTPEQEFFLSYARIWRQNSRPEETAMLIQSDPHSPPEWRIKGILANSEEFHQAFNVKDGDDMHKKNIDNVW